MIKYSVSEQDILCMGMVIEILIEGGNLAIIYERIEKHGQNSNLEKAAFLAFAARIRATSLEIIARMN